MIAIERRIREEGWTQTETAARLHVTQPRVSDLLNGKVSKFSLDALVNMLAPVGLTFDVRPVQRSPAPAAKTVKGVPGGSFNQGHVEQAQSAQQALTRAHVGARRPVRDTATVWAYRRVSRPHFGAGAKEAGSHGPAERGRPTAVTPAAINSSEFRFDT
jgi:transcriptional regulator with XRE-family HTH domain